MKTANLHFMGIGGQGISAVAQMARLAGEVVTGCDRQASATTGLLEQAGIPVQIGHSASHLEGVDTLVLSPAVPALDPANPELLAAHERGIPVVPWQELLGKFMQGKCVLSVSGVHGKGTTTAMLALMLVDAGLDPTCEIGAIVPRFGANYRLGKSDFFVNEADEFNHNFWHYHPRLTIVTSIEFEHPEFFADYAAYLDAFEHFIRGMDMTGDWPVPPTLILNVDSQGCADLRNRLSDWQGRIVTYAVVEKSMHAASIDTKQASSESEIRIASNNVTNIELYPSNQKQATFEAFDVRLEGETSFRVRSQDGTAFSRDIVFHLNLPGIHNVENALAALTAASIVGVDAGTIQQSLASFSGIRRRFDIRHNGPLLVNGKRVNVMLVDDYAHHPTAIAATLAATRKRYPDRRILAVYQPHMFSRTKTFFDQFLTAFADADVTMIADIFPARERDTGLVSAQQLVEAMQPYATERGKQVLHGGSVQATAELLRGTLQSGDIALIMGAGDIYTVTDMLLKSTEAN
ncbi:MAG TPA: Mur ligase domain-containing protein [Ktedonobacteraceae bacterium]|nr:Mur ligase domain-containing protein [Ktedonobacteraceae bacterium]